MSRRRFAAVIVNYNCAPLAIDAALSVIGAAHGDARAIIVDSASPDGSAGYFRAVANGRIRPTPEGPATAPEAVRFAKLSSLTMSLGDAAHVELRDDLTIVLAAENRGFAAGCNIGLAALAGADCDAILLLNPDALVASTSLDAFRRRLADPAIGLCGASVVGFALPHAVQAFGGARLDPLTLLGENLGAGLALSDAPDTAAIERRLDYPLGAAMAFRPDYLAEAGLLDERYFLYYEEADWALAGAASRRVGWAREAVVYHRYGGATGSARTNAGEASARSALSDYHMARSRLLFAKKWRPHLAPALVGLGQAQALRRLMRGRLDQARAVALGSLPDAARAYPPAGR